MRLRQTASRRTKNRFREHKQFDILQEKDSVSCLGGKPGVLLKSLTPDWIGWVPADEIEILD